MSPPPMHSSPEADELNGIVFSDPDEPFTVKPLIEDLLRTRYCIPGSVFLVERVDFLSPIRRRYRAIRLLVSDGVSCVQAVLKSETHGLVDHHQIYAGCYVRVDSFEIRFVDVAEGVRNGDARQGKPGDSKSQGRDTARHTNARQMVYLVLDNPVTVGWNTTYMEILKSQRSDVVLAEDHEQGTEHENHVVLEKDELSVPADREHISPPASKPAHSPDYGSIGDPDPDDLEHIELAALEASKSEVDTIPAEPSSRPSSNALQQSSSNLRWMTDDPTKPVKLTSLRLIPNLPYKQNWMVNVLAVVTSLSDVEPSHLPPYHQRTARLADPSTSKQVLLTVFLDPDDFNPTVGSVVLLLGVKNHRFDGGSLKKYASDRPKNGGRWWFEEPAELGWCDVAGMREWWHGKRTT